MRAPDGGPPGAADIVSRVNRELSQGNPDMMFVTLFFALLTPATGEVEYCNAGHNPPYRLKDSDLVPIEDARGIILGVRAGATHPAGRLQLAPGETIYLFTDGVTEATDMVDEQFSEERLEAVLRRSGGKPSAEIIDAVAAELRGFVNGAEASDDITMLALRRTEGMEG
jgi:phosphoserine phosphatase RsbU/P